MESPDDHRDILVLHPMTDLTTLIEKPSGLSDLSSFNSFVAVFSSKCFPNQQF